MVKIFVGNVNPKSRSEDLRKRFELYGKVTECDIVNNFAFVHMENEASAQDAISNLHLSDFDGYKINVELSQRTGKKGGSGGGAMRRRPNGRFHRFDGRDNRNGPPPRGAPYSRNGSYPSNRDNRYGVSHAWGAEDYGPMPPRGPVPPPPPPPSRGYDGYGSRPYDRYGPPPHPSRDFDRNPCPPYAAGGGGGGGSGGYAGAAPEPVPPPPRDVGRRPSPPHPFHPRSRYDNYDNPSNFRDYDGSASGGYRESGPSSYGGNSVPPMPGSRADEYSYEGYASEFSSRDYRDYNRGSYYGAPTGDYGYYGDRNSASSHNNTSGSRSPPRNPSSAHPYGYGRH